MKTWQLVASLALLALIANRRRDLLALVDSSSGPAFVAVEGPDGEAVGVEPAQGGGPLEGAADLLAWFDPATWMPNPGDEMTQANRAAFLWMIRTAEGTAGPNGYRTMFGGRLFDGWADHPRIAVQFTDRAGRRLWTTAAGAYQFMARSPIPGGGSTRVDTWSVVRDRLGLPDFSPASQDAAALELIREKGALADVDAGRFAAAVDKVRSVWASMPGAGYAQPEKSLPMLAAVFTAAGGTINEG